MSQLQSEHNNFSYPVLGVCLVLALVYLSVFVGSWLNYIAFAFCAYRLVRYDVRTFSIDYCFFISIATIFAFPGGLSCVVVLSLLAGCWFIVHDGLIIDNSLVVLLLLVNYLLIRMQLSYNNFILCVSQLLIIYLMISSIDADTIQLNINVFIVGVTISSLFALIFRNTSYIIGITGYEVTAFWGSNLTRFQGLFRDPNYYMSLVIMSIVLLTQLKIKKQISNKYFVFEMGCMFVFGALTYSKTFLILLCLYWTVYAIYLFRKNRLIAIIFIGSTIVLAFFLANTLFSTTITRIVSASSISELTTGRSTLFKTYFQVIFSSIKNMIIGAGLSANILKQGTHNLFLEIQYYVGLIGLTLFFAYFSTLIVWMRQKSDSYNKEHGLINYFAIVIFLILFCALQGMFSVLVYALLYIAIISIGIPKTISYKEQDDEQNTFNCKNWLF